MNRIALTPDQQTWLREAWADPETPIRDMAQHLGMGWSTVTTKAHDLGLGNRPRSTVWLPKKVAEIRRRFEAGETRQAIASAMGLTLNAVTAKLHRLGLIGALATLDAPRLSDEQLARLRRVAEWDTAAREGLALYERSNAA